MTKYHTGSFANVGRTWNKWHILNYIAKSMWTPCHQIHMCSVSKLLPQTWKHSIIKDDFVFVFGHFILLELRGPILFQHETIPVHKAKAWFNDV